MIIVRSPAKLIALAHRIDVCRLTVRRRIDGLVEAKFSYPQDGRYAITDAGIAALGPDAPQRQPWVNLERGRAATAKDVVARTAGSLKSTRAQKQDRLARRAAGVGDDKAAPELSFQSSMGPWRTDRLGSLSIHPVIALCLLTHLLAVILGQASRSTVFIKNYYDAALGYA